MYSFIYNEYAEDRQKEYDGKTKTNPKLVRQNKGAGQEDYGGYLHSESLEHQADLPDDHISHK